MDELKFNTTGTDAAYLANVNMFFTALFDLDIFKNGWPEEKLGSQNVLQDCVGCFKQNFEGGLTGNRLQIAARKSARSDLDVRIQRILHYLAVMADEGDFGKILGSSVVTKKNRKRARRTSKPTLAN